MLQLEKGEEVHRYYISKEGLEGEFDIRLIVEDKKYETGLKVNF